LAACSGENPESQNAEPAIKIEEAKPTPRYDERDGSKYMYVGALSEDDQAAGKKAPDVTTFQFAGKKGEVFVLEALDGDGSVAGTVECKNPCKIVTVRYGPVTEKVGFTPDSIMGAALQDAFDGFLEVKTP
jgi:hypothetical protein